MSTSSKLPKPSGLKVPQIRVPIIRAQDTNSILSFHGKPAALHRRSKSVTDLTSVGAREKLLDFKLPARAPPTKVNGVKELKAPPRPPLSTFPSNFKQQSVGMRRRSKSVTDLSSLSRSRPIDLKMLPEVLQKVPQTEIKKQAPSKAVKKQAVPLKAKVEVTKKTASKRPLQENIEDGATKPKVYKKLPEWDYKGRFSQLTEKYKILEEQTSNLKKKSETAISEYTKIEEEVIDLRQNRKILEKRCLKFDEISEELTKLKPLYESLVEEHKKAVEELSSLIVENEKNASEAKRINGLYNNLQQAHEKITEQYQDVTAKYEKLSKISAKALDKVENLTKTLEERDEEIVNLKNQVETLESSVFDLETKRRMMHNVIQDLKGNIRVFCRVRPPLSSEQDKMECYIAYVDENGLELRKSHESISQITGKAQETRSEFTFDKVFSHQSKQEEVFEDLAQLVQSALDGYDVCVFAYGQTGSGKTYTMQGEEGVASGMIPRTVRLIFKTISRLEKEGWKYEVHASFLEIYNENVRDLLNVNSNQKMEIYFNEGKGTTVTNLTIQAISTANELEQYIRIAQTNRATAATNFNEHSSRSHSVTKIYLQGTFKDQNIVYKGSINLVDLAGSENAKQSVGERLIETKNINKSLSTLGNVISALHNKSKHVPYRDSKLTYLLQSSLGGSSKTLMIVNIAPLEECFLESINSLRFASKVKEVKTASKRNKMII
ncbi:carboxy-terminal kinesin 2 [Anthonomus grandis grandis]|uniref:carboxy-terminal kinesin 2 n=1 Tax=Anthonomus grandis grandis TaxID=2921223 RepID=UPI002165998B|nr:carboxy-terminal kinesin 2 [Anthonomus grandis grandis]